MLKRMTVNNEKIKALTVKTEQRRYITMNTTLM